MRKDCVRVGSECDQEQTRVACPADILLAPPRRIAGDLQNNADVLQLESVASENNSHSCTMKDEKH